MSDELTKELIEYKDAIWCQATGNDAVQDEAAKQREKDSEQRLLDLFKHGEDESNLEMLTYLLNNKTEQLYANGEFKHGGWLCNTALSGVTANRIETERRKLIATLTNKEKGL